MERPRRQPESVPLARQFPPQRRPVLSPNRARASCPPATDATRPPSLPVCSRARAPLDLDPDRLPGRGDLPVTRPASQVACAAAPPASVGSFYGYVTGRPISPCVRHGTTGRRLFQSAAACLVRKLQRFAPRLVRSLLSESNNDTVSFLSFPRVHGRNSAAGWHDDGARGYSSGIQMEVSRHGRTAR
jgi:hypothetical protein